MCKIKANYIWIIMITVSLTFIFCSKSKNANDLQAAPFVGSPQQTSHVQNASAELNESIHTATKAIESAQASQQYLFMLFYGKKDDAYQQMEEVIINFQHSSSKEMQIYTALTTDLKEADIIQEYGINRAPLPIVLVFAPNGAITGGFPKQITREQLEKSIVSELTMNILKSVQANKVALVLFKSDKTTFNHEVTKAADDFSADKRLNGSVDIIQQNPQDAGIKDFLAQCKLDNNLKEATAVLVVPPGRIGGVYSGDITKETIIAGLAACSAGSGCCPK